jgi:uncharacterized repeat protein (TIGR03803 family)
MQSKMFSIALTVMLAILAMTPFLTGTRAAAQQETVLHSFGPNGQGGGYPNASLIFDAAGNLYGTAKLGGANSCGVVFELTKAGVWTEKVLHAFCDNRKDGGAPLASLIFDATGNLYGTTSAGGALGGGTAFELSPASGGGWTEKILHNFDSSFGNGGYEPSANLIFNAAGNLYGTVSRGGFYNHGAVFELTPASGGGWSEKVLHAFNDSGKDGAVPTGGLIFDAGGNLYGTTAFGGTYFYGIVFELTPTAGGKWSEKVLHEFADSGTDGQQPDSSLIFDAAGNLYSTGLGSYDYYGTVFELTPTAGGNWNETLLHNFEKNDTDGYYPLSSLVFDGAGNLYGTTQLGGAYASGTVFKLSPQAGGGWIETVLHDFGNGTDGATPYAGLTFDAAGNLYGTTQQGGAYGYGTVFEIKP